MIRPVYYSENDPAKVAWLRNNIDAGLVAYGLVDNRSIKDVTPNDIRGFAQHHWFAGVGGWSVAARLAGWHDNRPIWSASAPCQPFSAAGDGAGTDDPRHLWPDLYRLIDPSRPPVIVGEQVSGAAGLNWFDGVRADLETAYYASRGVDVPACAVDSPQQRQRNYWCAIAMADSESECRRAGFCDSGSGRLRWLEPTDGDGVAAPGRWSRPDRTPVDRPLDRADRAGRQGLGRDGFAGERARAARSAPAPDDGNRSLVHGEGNGRGEGRAGTGIFGGRATASGADAPNRASAGGLASTDRQGRPEPDQLPRRGIAAQHGDDLDRRDGPEPEHARGADLPETLDGGGRVGRPARGNSDRGDERDIAGAGNEHRRNGSWWSGAEWIECHDQKARRVADASAPLLVDGIRGQLSFHRPNSIRIEGLPEGHPLRADTRSVNRVAAWSGFGDAICVPLAAEAIGALMDILPAWHE